MRVLTDVSCDLSPFQGCAVTLGNFDGLHLGHQALLRAARGAVAGGPLAVLTFQPHPVQVLYPERGLRCLFPREDLTERLPEHGVDLLLVLPFDRAMAGLSARAFLDRFIAPLNPRGVIIGYDFAFGHRREGGPELIREWARQRGTPMTVLRVDPVLADGQPVSSRRVRDRLAAGDVTGARALLGRHFYLRGPRETGDGRGRALGFPTLNQATVNESLPAPGVYATWFGADGAVRRSITNIGVHPTFGAAGRLKVETHVLEPFHDVADRTYDLGFVVRLRDERRFASAQDLKDQIEKDILKAHEALDRDQPGE